MSPMGRRQREAELRRHRPPDGARFDHVACLIDGSDASAATIEAAARFRGPGGTLSVLFCDETSTCPLVFPMGEVWAPNLAELRESTRTWLCGVAGTVRDAEPVLLEGPPSWSLVAWARTAVPDLVVIAEPRRRPAFLGGIRLARLSRHLACPLLVLPGQAADSVDGATSRGHSRQLVAAVGRSG